MRHPDRDGLIAQPWLTILRAAWIVLVLAYLGVYAAGIGPRLAELRTLCLADCPYLTLTPGEAELLAEWGLSVGFYVYFQVGIELLLITLFTSVGAVIFLNRSSDWIGLVVSLTLVVFSANFLSENDQVLANAYPSLRFVIDGMGGLTSWLFLLLFYIFPDGRFVPRWTRWTAALVGGLAVLSPVFPALSMVSIEAWQGPLAAVYVAYLLGGAAAQVYRYRAASNPVQRQQIKWVILGLGTTALSVIIFSLVFGYFAVEPGEFRLLFSIVGMGVLVVLIGLLPVSIAISILRYRLWDIDVLIRRTLQYSLLTAVLALMYSGSVVLFQTGLRTLAGTESQVELVISTLLIAALFNPVRRRVQAIIDRRFFRQKYDSQRALEQFGERLRDEVDLAALSGTLQETVEETLRPSSMSLALFAPRTFHSQPHRATTTDR